jgi:hypothetical protein
MNIINHYEIVVRMHYDKIMCYLRFYNGDEQECSSLYFLSEVNSVINDWRNKELMGSFGFATVLAEDATFELVNT